MACQHTAYKPYAGGRTVMLEGFAHPAKMRTMGDPP